MTRVVHPGPLLATTLSVQKYLPLLTNGEVVVGSKSWMTCRRTATDIVSNNSLRMGGQDMDSACPQEFALSARINPDKSHKTELCITD